MVRIDQEVRLLWHHGRRDAQEQHRALRRPSVTDPGARRVIQDLVPVGGQVIDRDDPLPRVIRNLNGHGNEVVRNVLDVDVDEVLQGGEGESGGGMNRSM